MDYCAVLPDMLSHTVVTCQCLGRHIVHMILLRRISHVVEITVDLRLSPYRILYAPHQHAASRRAVFCIVRDEDARQAMQPYRVRISSDKGSGLLAGLDAELMLLVWSLDTADEDTKPAFEAQDSRQAGIPAMNTGKRSEMQTTCTADSLARRGGGPGILQYMHHAIRYNMQCNAMQI